MARRCHYLQVSPALVVQINVLLIVVAVIFMLDVIGHHYLRSHTFPGLRLYPVALRNWMLWVRALTLLAYILNAIVGIRMAKNPSLLKFALYLIIGFMVLLYNLVIASTRFMYRRKFEFFARQLVIQIWNKDKLGPLEVEFTCCGVTGARNYQMSKTNRTWSSDSCCEKPECPGCLTNVTKYLWVIEMEVARDNFFVSIFLVVGLIFMLLFYKDVELFDDPYVKESDDDFEYDSEYASE
ncbi:hypothetical protein KR038_001289, partial [Drosophila bunnanda]